MPNCENLTDAVQQRANDAIHKLNRILHALDEDPAIGVLASTYVSLDKLNGGLAKLAKKLPLADE